MFLEIISPEATLFSGEVKSVTVSGVNGSFQMLDHHAPIVSILDKGIVKIQGDITIAKEFASKVTQNGNETRLHLSSGTIEMCNNKATLLSDGILEG